MRIISRKTLEAFWLDYPDSEQALKAWFFEAKHAQWRRSHDIKAKYGSARIVGNNRVVFNICGNKYRLVVKVAYSINSVYIRFIGTHKQYDKINVETVYD